MTPDDFHGDSDIAAAVQELLDETDDRIILLTDGMLTKPNDILDLYNSTDREIFVVQLDEYIMIPEDTQKVPPSPL
jgi:vacuolar-type H+-ATPase subunit F/Vma7